MFASAQLKVAEGASVRANIWNEMRIITVVRRLILREKIVQFVSKRE